MVAASDLLAGEAPRAAGRAVSIVLDPDDGTASAAPAKWAVAELQQALARRSITARILPHMDGTAAGDLCIVVAGSAASSAQDVIKAIDVAPPSAAESLVLAEGKLRSRPVLLACGADVSGLVYAVLELADRVRYAAEPLQSLRVPKPIVEQPANVVRSIMRCFVCETTDKAWYNDRDGWRQYLTMLATNRINRLQLAFGVAYDDMRGVTDAYFLFAYPYLVALPGYNVRATGLPDRERDHNLEMLRFISDETAARGMQFQLGLWTHGYQWKNSPHPEATIEGLNPQTHAPYCRDALAAVLKACPAISGLTMRIHGESGVPDGSYGFWSTLFDAIKNCGRRVEIDMHAKGITQEMIDIALATHMPVNISPKFWGEHMGLPYHQAGIRELEMAREGEFAEGPRGIGTGSRKFMRYGYGDLLTEDRPYGIVHRIWPGTRRLLMSGDPETCAGYGRASSFCGSLGVELFEPLSFKGRQGTGDQPGGRCGYSDPSLIPERDWQKFLYTYRVWGRLIYNPDTDASVWQRVSRQELGEAAAPLEQAMGAASRILPLITVAHAPSGSNMSYWPEIYTNQSILNTGEKQPYKDTVQPPTFGNVSPFDPQLFYSVNEFADALVDDKSLDKYTPLEVGQWLEEFADAASAGIAAAGKGKLGAAARRWMEDVAIQAGIGRFFARKMKSALLWQIYTRLDDAQAGDEAVKSYRSARDAWADMADRAAKVYVRDLTFGTGNERGDWLDRVAAMDEDLKKMEETRMASSPTTRQANDGATRRAMSPFRRPAIDCRHSPPKSFRRGEPVEIQLSTPTAGVRSVRLRYRHVNQAERWKAKIMDGQDSSFHALIDADYSQSRFPLQYYFDLDCGDAGVSLYPGFSSTLSNFPYFTISNR